MSRRTTGDSTMLSPPTAVAASSGAGALGAGSGSDGAGGAGAGSGGASTGVGAGAGSDTMPAPSSLRMAITAPTSTMSPSAATISTRTPDMGDGTSESTLSVDTSKSGSSSATCSPTCLNHWTIVPSTTVSPSWGILTSDTEPPRRFSSLLFGPHCLQCRALPVRDSTDSPNNSLIVGWGWTNSATSGTVASQFTAR